VQILQQAMWSWAGMPAYTHTVLSCTAGRPPVDRSLCHHDYRTCMPHPADSALSFDTPQLCRRYAYTVECRGPRHAHAQQGRRAARYCIGLIPLMKKKFAAASAAGAIFFLSGVRPRFFLIL